MIFVFDGDETERLQHAIERLAHGAQNFGHAVHRAGLGLERDFDKVALHQRLRQTQQSTRGRDSLQPGFCAAAVLKPDRSQDRISELDTGSTPRGVRLGEVGHMPTALWHHPPSRNRLLRPIVRIPRPGPELTIGSF